jgi:hypothetical protein
MASARWSGIYNKVLYFDQLTGATMELAKVDAGAAFPRTITQRFKRFLSFPAY